MSEAEAKAVLTAAGYVVLKARSYRQAQERQRCAEALMQAEKEHRQDTERWARLICAEERKAWARTTYLYGVASRLGATAAELQGWESNDVVPE